MATSAFVMFSPGFMLCNLPPKHWIWLQYLHLNHCNHDTNCESLLSHKYSVILSVLDPRKWEYLKDYSLGLNMHIWLHTLLHEKHVDTCFPLSENLTSSGQRLASGAMPRTAASLCCAVVKETLNTARYLKIFNEFVDQLDDDELRNGYFQHVGATCLTSNENMTEIESFFDDRIISKALWPPRSPDLRPPDFFLWGALKGKAYANKQRTIQEMENNIGREIAAISEDVLQATFANMKLYRECGCTVNSFPCTLITSLR